MPTAETYARDIEYYKEYKKDPENKKKEHQRYLDNKESIKARSKADYEANREKYNKMSKERVQKLKEEDPEGYDKKRKKTQRMSKWKKWGIDVNDELYNRYLNCDNCEICNMNIESTSLRTKYSKVLDHNHATGEVRYICCHGCNMRMGEIDKKFKRVMDDIILLSSLKKVHYILR
tara:strand:+ start:97 stop:624 length:528 start_codon:yes stop_codon:yes gene_type:complete